MLFCGFFECIEQRQVTDNLTSFLVVLTPVCQAILFSTVNENECHCAHRVGIVTAVGEGHTGNHALYLDSHPRGTGWPIQIRVRVVTFHLLDVQLAKVLGKCRVFAGSY